MCKITNKCSYYTGLFWTVSALNVNNTPKEINR